MSGPRVRNAEEKFESRLLPLFTRRTKEVSELITQPYLHGLSEGAAVRLRELYDERDRVTVNIARREPRAWLLESEEDQVVEEAVSDSLS